MKRLFIGGPRDGDMVDVPYDIEFYKAHVSAKLKGLANYGNGVMENLAVDIVTYVRITLYTQTNKPIVVYAYDDDRARVMETLVAGYRRLDIASYDDWLQEVEDIRDMCLKEANYYGHKVNLLTESAKKILLKAFEEGKRPIHAYEILRHYQLTGE